MMRRMGHAFSILLAATVGGVLFFYAFHGIRLAELAETLSRFSLGWLPVLVALPLLDLLIRSYRWRLLLRPVVGAGIWELFQFEAIGLAINNLLFLRVGEVARGVVAGQELGVHTLSVLATIVVERLCDTAALMTLFVACSLAGHESVAPRFWSMALLLVAAIVAVLAAITVAGARFRESAPWLHAHPRTCRVLEDLILGTRALRSWASALEIAGLSLGLWFCDAAIFWAASRGMGFSPSLGWVDSLIVLAGAAASSALPAVPGAFGNFEAAVGMTLSHMGYPKSIAIGLATFVHVLTYLIVTSMGITFLYRLGHTFSSLRRVLQRHASDAGKIGARS